MSPVRNSNSKKYNVPTAVRRNRARGRRLPGCRAGCTAVPEELKQSPEPHGHLVLDGGERHIGGESDGVRPWSDQSPYAVHNN